jgi:hypothetical protein
LISSFDVGLKGRKEGKEETNESSSETNKKRLERGGTLDEPPE